MAAIEIFRGADGSWLMSTSVVQWERSDAAQCTDGSGPAWLFQKWQGDATVSIRKNEKGTGSVCQQGQRHARDGGCEYTMIEKLE
eukprot:758302-Hanusia_phi.AAC.1